MTLTEIFHNYLGEQAESENILDLIEAVGYWADSRKPTDALAQFNQVVTRFEVIDHTSTGEGREYTKWVETPFSVTLQLQDDNRTLKVFLADKEQ